METLEIVKLILSKLDQKQLIEVRELVNGLLSRGTLLERVKHLWQHEGKIAAIREYKDHICHVHEPSLVECKSFVEWLCKDIPDKYK